MALRRRMTQSQEPDGNLPRKQIDREGIRSFSRLLAYVRPNLGWFIISLIALAISTALGLVLPLVVQSLVDGVLIENNFQELNRLGGSLLIVFLVQAIFSFINRLSLDYVGEKGIAAIRNEFYAHLQTMSLRFYANGRTGSILSLLTNDISLLKDAITSNLTSLLRQVLTLIGASIFLFILDWRLTLLILTGIPIISLTMVYLGRKIRAAASEAQEQLGEAANIAEETISGVRIVKSFARESYEYGRFATQVDATFDASMKRARLSATLAPIIGFMAFASITLTLWFGSYEVINGRLTVGGLVAYLVYTMLVAAPIGQLAGLYAQFQAALGAIDRVFAMLDTPAEITDHPKAKPIPTLQGHVQFEKVDFDYTAEARILRNVTFDTEPGQVIALVGPSGAGKTTLVNLIPRFYDIQDGRITIDGYDIREVTLKSLRQQIGIVPQETILFSDSVFNNIRYGNLEASQEEVEAAAKAANAHDFIMRDLPHSYDTLVGERGIKLSGGQRQRVAIARAILKDPRILILDEATSSLDSESEHLVQDALETLMQGRTSFVIAHRLSTIQNADWVLVLDNGGIVEQGTHTSLLADPNGLYRRLHDMQFAPDTPKY